MPNNTYLIKSRMKKLTNLLGGGSYTTPDIEIHSVTAEQGFFVSNNPDLDYGGAGAAGEIGDGGNYEL